MIRRSFLLAIAVSLSACAAVIQGGYVTRSVDELQQTITAQGHPTIIDVREPDEFAGGHVPDAVNVPLATLGDWAASHSKDAPYLVICHSGRRSAKAATLLSDRGFTRVTNVAGGTAAWIKQGLPVAH